jgi:phage-related protein
MAMGKIYFPKHSKWADTVIDEMLHFPHGNHDDAVDALSLIGRVLDTTYSPGFSVYTKKRRDMMYGDNILTSARKVGENQIKMRRRA